ncbi:OmpA family protein [Tateyamaria sp. syn59]|uniref:OmpA family protein n=1 Tax=Tateyamaria sp. syn59 TaxID=2576942 RepID=UPI0011BEA69C|nr:OmpA family protein [Tateyamaria sp. syn59]
MRGKAKQREMRALRAAGLTLAGAERLTQTKGSSTLALSVFGGLGIIVLAGVSVLSLNMPASEPAEAGQHAALDPDPATPEISNDVATAAVTTTPVATATAPALATSPADEPAELPWHVALESGSETDTQQVEPSASVKVTEDCVVALAADVSGVRMQFDAGSALVPPGSYDKLWQIGTQVNACPEARVLVAGHSDSSGSDLANLQLSWSRAENTVEALSALGIDTRQFETVGFGSRAPLEQGSDADNGVNRRVELRVLKGGTR